MSGVRVWNGPEPIYEVSGRGDAAGRLVQAVDIADSAARDAFGRLRVSNPLTLFESSFEYDLQPTWFESVTANGGTVAYGTANRSAILTAGTAAGSSALLQTRQYWPYEKGKSQLVKTTFTLGTAVAGITREVGYGDAANGVFLQQTGDGLAMVLRSSTSGTAVDTVVPQAQWNADPLNGTGPSGVNLDVRRQQILVIDAQFLGAGRIRTGFNIDGETIVAHQFLNANRNATAPYMQTFNLPVRWRIAATGATAGATFQAICCDVESEGGVGSPNGYTFTGVNTADVNTSGTRAHVLSIRPAATFNGITNRSFVIPLQLDVQAAGNTVLVEVFHATSLSGGTWTAADAASAVEVGIGQTLGTLGKRVDAFFVAASAQARGSNAATIADSYPLTLSVAGADPQALTVTATTVTGTGTCRAALRWKEIR